MTRRLQMTALTLMLTGFTALALIGVLLPWEHRIFGATTPGISTQLGYWVFVSVLIMGALLIGRLVQYTEPRKFELPIVGVASVALLVMLGFYLTQIGRPDRTLSHSTFGVEVGGGFFVTLGALLAIEVTVAAHRFGVWSWLWMDKRYADADT